jgi:hypothetical protein
MRHHVTSYEYPATCHDATGAARPARTWRDATSAMASYLRGVRAWQRGRSSLTGRQLMTRDMEDQGLRNSAPRNRVLACMRCAVAPCPVPSARCSSELLSGGIGAS